MLFAWSKISDRVMFYILFFLHKIWIIKMLILLCKYIKFVLNIDSRHRDLERDTNSWILISIKIKDSLFYKFLIVHGRFEKYSLFDEGPKTGFGPSFIHTKAFCSLWCLTSMLPRRWSVDSQDLNNPISLNAWHTLFM